MSSEPSGILLVDKPRGKTAFNLVARLRRHLGVKKIGHAGTLDPFATGVMVMLVGRAYTRLSDQLLCQDKEYSATLQLGVATDTYDCEGKITRESPLEPTLEELQIVLQQFQGEISQIPPMFSAKKIQGKKLYELARKGLTVERKACLVRCAITLESYTYPIAKLHIACSKGTYIRSLAHEIGEALHCGAHLTELRRVRSGQFQLKDCIDGKLLDHPECDRTALLNSLYQSRVEN